MGEDQTEEFTYTELQALKRHARDGAIEACARVLEEYHRQNMMFGEDNGWFVNAIAAIRAMKDAA